MNHLLPIPIIIIAAAVLVVCIRHKFKTFQIISKVVIAICTVWFILEYSKYLGYDIIAWILSWFKF